jgi:hypothetical protein
VRARAAAEDDVPTLAEVLARVAKADADAYPLASRRRKGQPWGFVR